MKDWHKVVLTDKSTIRDGMRALSEGVLRIAVVCDANNKLLGVVTDGDIRRGLLVDCDMQDSITTVMSRDPITIHRSSSRNQRLKLMKKNDLLALPIVEEGCLIGIQTLKDLIDPLVKENPVLIMAGGFGTRLKPLTDHCPKPMLKVGDKPMLEHLLEQFIYYGYKNFYISTHYMPEVIQEYFGDGSKWDVSITYVHEAQPLGTGGALGLLPKERPNLPLIVINGDVLTKVDFDLLLSHHEKQHLDATMCVRELEHQVPFGVIESNDGLVVGMTEKPNYLYRVNTGVYVLSPECVASVVPNTIIDMPTLLENRREEGKKVGIYTSYDYWLDIGRMDDYQKVQHDIKLFFPRSEEL